MNKFDKNQRENREKKSTAVKGDWVRIHSIVLKSGERAGHVPEDTRKTPLQMWNKGFLVTAKAAPGMEVEIETVTGRRIQGKLTEVNPSYDHSFGSFIPEISAIDLQLKNFSGRNSNE